MATPTISIHILHTDTWTYMYHTWWRISLIWHDSQQGQCRLAGQNMSECFSWSVKLSFAKELSTRQSYHLLISKTHPSFTLISESQEEKIWVNINHVNINIIKQHFLLTNIQMFSRNSESYLKRHYHRMLWNSQSYRETESQSFSSSLSHRGLVWS